MTQRVPRKEYRRVHTLGTETYRRLPKDIRVALALWNSYFFHMKSVLICFSMCLERQMKQKASDMHLLCFAEIIERQ